MHGWLAQVELYGAWFLEITQHQLVVFVFFFNPGPKVS